MTPSNDDHSSLVRIAREFRVSRNGDRFCVAGDVHLLVERGQSRVVGERIVDERVEAFPRVARWGIQDSQAIPRNGVVGVERGISLRSQVSDSASKAPVNPRSAAICCNALIFLTWPRPASIFGRKTANVEAPSAGDAD
jgi:hypothetical protein